MRGKLEVASFRFLKKSLEEGWGFCERIVALEIST